MHSQRGGNGPRLFVGLHGWAGTMAAFEPLLPHLPSDAALLRFDLPGCGRSPRPARWDLDEIADEVARAISGEIDDPGRPAGPLTLAGSCSGALFALLAARRLGGRVGRIVLIDPFAWLPAQFRLFAAPVWGRRAYALTFENPVGRWIANAGLAHRRSGRTHLTRFFERTDHEANRKYMEMFARTDPRAVLKSLRGWDVPVEIAYGSRTFGAVRKSVPVWRETFPQARVTEVPGAGHLPMRDAPGALAAILFGDRKLPPVTAGQPD